MDAARYDDLRGRLLGLLIRLGDRLTLHAQDLMHELLDHNELGLALEMMCGALADVLVL
jgi:hypothetical protein